jgi:cell division transport system permease protein
MWGRHSVLPFAHDPLARFLPWLIAFMTYLAVLGLAGFQVLNGVVDQWHRDLSGTFTVQIPVSGNAETDDANVRAALDILWTAPEVTHADSIPESRIVEMLAPWLGSEDVARDLPLPKLIDVTLRQDARSAAAALAERLEAAVPGTVIDDHGVWLGHMVRLIRTAEVITGVVLVLIGLVTAGTVVYATRSGLAIHHDAIELLHIIGARDAYVARQFAVRALAFGLKGGVAGLVFGAATLFGLDRLAARLQGGPLPDFGLTPVNWAILALVPLAAAIIAMLTARATVMRNLTSMF